MTTEATAVRHVHLEAAGGAAGDMFAAALLDALPELTDRVFADVAAVLPAGCGEANLTKVMAGGIAARHFELIGDGAKSAVPPGHAGIPPDAHGQSGHAQNAPHSAHGHPHHHHHDGHGTYREMRDRIGTAALAEGTADHARAILGLLAAAEAGIHGMAVDDVHFHEIGDWDSLMDVVAAGSIAAALAGVTWSVSDLPLGNGLVKTAHGLLPVPAPATAALLAGYGWRDDGVGGERVTPTGAAIIRHLTGGKPGRREGGMLLGMGYGAGSRVLPGMPNVLRVSLFAAGATAPDRDEVRVVECDIDDMTGEELALAADRLRAAAGVRDVILTPGTGKKGRPVTTFRLLAEPAALDAVVRAVLLETSTLGVRWHDATRRILQREDRGGTPRAKAAERPDGRVTVKAESDDLAGIATLAARRAAAGTEDDR